ncbi:MAG: LeuA family protein [Acidobacteriota bacterium]
MSHMPPSSDLIYDWNTAGNGYPHRASPVEFDDETLRDGLQSPSVRDPTIEKKFELLHVMAELGIHSADLGLPGAGPRARADIIALCGEIQSARLPIKPNCAVRTVMADVQALVDIADKVGMPIEACTFIGSSPIRQYAEEWSLDYMVQLTEETISFAVKHGLPVMYVTEDTCRATPDTIRRLLKAAIGAGAARVCVCDTVGHVSPRGVRNLIPYVRQLIKETGADIKVDWHGHNDRGLSVINTITAMTSGADRVHATALGLGERIGNCSMDQLLVNLKLMGYIDSDLLPLHRYVAIASESTGVPIPANYPIFGGDAFRTATGVHAAAIIKAKKKGDDWLADRIYSGVPAGMLGMKQRIDVGFMSGVSNVVHWLLDHGFEPEERLVQEVFRAAKERDRILTDDELIQVVKFVLGEPEQGLDVGTAAEWTQTMNEP